MMRLPKFPRVAGVALVAGSLILTGCTAEGAPEQKANGPTDGWDDMEPIVLTYSDSNVDTAAHVMAMKTFMEEVTEASEGKITFDTYYSAALHPATEALSAIESGLTDITFVAPSNVPDSMANALWESIVAQDVIEPEFPNSLIQGTPVQFAAFQEGPLADELAAFDATTLATWGTATNSMLCKSEVTSADDVQGKLVRVPGPPLTHEVEKLGMTPVTLPVTDVFEGLQRGVINCFMNVVSPFITLGIWEEAKYFVPAHFATSIGSQLIMNKSVLESLPKKAQQVIFDARIDLLADIIEATVARYAQWAEEAPGKGVTFVDPAEFNASIDQARKAYIKDALANPPAGISDPNAYIDELSAVAAEWDGLASGLDIESGSPSTQQGWIDLYKSVEDIDWDAYTATLHEMLDKYRP